MKRPPKPKINPMIAFAILVALLLAGLVWRLARPIPEAHWTGTYLGRPWLVIIQDRALTDGLKSSFDANIGALLTQLETRFLRQDGLGLVAEFNATTSTIPAYVGTELWRVVNVAKRVGQTTPAADITLANLQDLWTRVYAGQITAPPDTALQSLLRDTGMDRINAPAEGYIRKLRPDVKIDVTSGAEGYAADRIEIMMLENKIETFHVQIGGTVLTRGRTPRPPSPITYGPGLKPLATTHVALASAQMTTRGRADGYLHIDPRTGRPVANKIRTVTVIAETGLAAATLADTLYTLGPEAGLKWIEANSALPGRALLHLDGPLGTTTVLHSPHFPIGPEHTTP